MAGWCRVRVVHGASRAGYAWRRRRQPDVCCAVDLSCAAGRFLLVEAGWSVSDLLTRLAGKGVPSVSEQGLALQFQDHGVALVELERDGCAGDQAL